MHIQIAVRHETADGRIKGFIEAELERIRVKFSPISADVVIDHEGGAGRLKTVEINIKVPGELIHVHESTDDMHASIELAIKAVEKKLQKVKDLHLKPTGLKRQLANEGE